MPEESLTDVEAFIGDFEACRLGRARWTHQAHLVAGFWYVWHAGMEAALAELRVRIKRHNESVGTANTDTSGYHETITRLYVTAIAEHIRRHDTLSFEACLESLLASPLADSQWPLSFYSAERLFSAEARRTWLEPDL